MNASNQCSFVGHFTKSPIEQLKKLSTGDSNLTISLAVKSQATDKDGNAYERTDYPQLTMWGELAESTAMSFEQGSEVEVRAQVQTRRFKAEDGSFRYVTEFLVSSIGPKAEAKPELSAEIKPESSTTTKPKTKAKSRSKTKDAA